MWTSRTCQSATTQSAATSGRWNSSQNLMKLWLLFHLPLVAALCVVALWHVLLVHIYAV